MRQLAEAYELQVLEAGAARPDARSQLVTGMLLGMGEVRDRLQRADGTDAHSTGAITSIDARLHFERALERAGRDRIVLWNLAHLASEETRAIAQAAARRLTEVEPENASGWLQLLHLQASQLTDAEQDRLFERAAGATRYSIHFVETAGMIAALYEAVALPPELLEHWQSMNGQYDAGAFLYMQAIATAMALTLPGYQQVVNGCRAEGGQRPQDACQAVGTLMVEHSDELIGQYIGLALMRESGVDAEALRQSRRRVEWQQQAFAKLLSELDPVDAMAWDVVGPMWRKGIPELAIVRSLLADAGVPLEPPAAFRSRSEQAADAAIGPGAQAH